MVLQKVLNKFGNVKNYPYLCIIMKREFIASVILVLFFSIAIVVVCLTTPQATTSVVEKVRIDSVYSKPRYEVMPELMWVYTTKQGSFTTNDIQKYKIGDSIEVKIIKRNETNNQK
jgi:hypothetical protein